MHKTTKSPILSPVSMGSACSFELYDGKFTKRLFGFIPIRTIQVSDVHYLRLAAKDEFSSTYLLFHWPSFLSHRRSARPIYILQTKKGRRIFLRLKGGAHFRIRQAIARKPEQREYRERIAA